MCLENSSSRRIRFFLRCGRGEKIGKQESGNLERVVKFAFRWLEVVVVTYGSCPVTGTLYGLVKNRRTKLYRNAGSLDRKINTGS